VRWLRGGMCAKECTGSGTRGHRAGCNCRGVLWGMCGVMLMLTIGCGRRIGPTVQFVKGRITLDGQLLEGAAVSLAPVAGSTGLPAYGITKPDGAFVLTSSRGGKVGAGAVAGDYIVTVKKMRLVGESDIGTLIARDDYEKQRRDYPLFTPEIPVVPPAYGDATTSSLRATVKKGRNVGPEFQFELRTDSNAR
jgi:hypothetical protein